MNICQNLLAQQSGVIYLFLECGHYFSDNATPHPLQPERPLFLHINENVPSGPQEHLAFSSVAHAASELLLRERWHSAVIYLVPPWFPVMEEKSKELTSQRLSSGL